MSQPDSTISDLARVLADLHHPASDREVHSQAWEKLYRLTRWRVYMICYQYSRGNPQVAQEMCEDTYHRLWTTWSKSQFGNVHTGEDLLRYVSQAAHSAGLDYRRALDRLPKVFSNVDNALAFTELASPPEDPGSDPLARAILEEDRRIARERVGRLSLDASLSQREREVLALYLLGLTSQQISSRLRISDNNVRVVMHHIRDALRKAASRDK